ncbi:VWA domain-containing protein [Candidatus Woesearchaeota archaeon]|nr:VWA domain-containing protein [Candidatus Woesearchaeota archaeon]
MVLIPDYSKVACISKFCLRYYYALFLIIPIAIILYFVMNRNFIKFMDKSEQRTYESSKKRQRMIFFATRIGILLFLLIAISSPFILEQKTIQGNPRITILSDNSTSFSMFEAGPAEELAGKLKGKVPIELRSIAFGEKSAIGDGMLNYLAKDENLLVVSDGNNNDGKLLGDIMVLASSLNATVSTLGLEAAKSDVSVWIDGPSEAIKDSEEFFTVAVSNVGKGIAYTLEVRVDGEIVLAKSSEGSGRFTVKKAFSEGYHKMEARLLSVGQEDYFAQNNQYYKTLKVVDRPKIAFVSEKNSPMASELAEIYDLELLSFIPSSPENYLAMIINDLPLSKIEPHYEKIEKFVNEGNGLLVIGGQSSYDRGNYKAGGALFPQLLPVRIGAGEESDDSDVQIVVAMDVSGTTTKVYDSDGNAIFRDYDQVIKALGVSVLDSLDKKNNVGGIVIGTPTSPFVGKVADIRKLEDHKSELVDKFSRLKGGGQSAIAAGARLAFNMLKNTQGGKNIVLISDGRGLTPLVKQEVLQEVRNAAARGIKTYVVGVGAVDSQDTQFLTDIATAGEGIYFPAGADNRLKILFGEPDAGKDKDYYNALAILDNTHFITYNVSINAVVSGYNYVLPKSSARTLVTTNKNIPILVAWRFGLGRIVTLATDDGGKWAGEMLQKDNSKVMIKSINWAIGDLGRKKNFDVSVKDISLDKSGIVRVISNNIPQDSKLSFVKSDVNTYTAVFEPEKAGFQNILGADVAVNYKSEYKELGMNKEFLNLVEQTGGKAFDKDDLDSILEFIKEKSKRQKVNSIDIKWPFLLIAIILFLLEIFLRRIWENKGVAG